MTEEGLMNVWHARMTGWVLSMAVLGAVLAGCSHETASTGTPPPSREVQAQAVAVPLERARLLRAEAA